LRIRKESIYVELKAWVLEEKDITRVFCCLKGSDDAFDLCFEEEIQAFLLINQWRLPQKKKGTGKVTGFG
jgi:hypothetical protein